MLFVHEVHSVKRRLGGILRARVARRVDEGARQEQTTRAFFGTACRRTGPVLRTGGHDHGGA